jgi:hypothetical protein
MCSDASDICCEAKPWEYVRFVWYSVDIILVYMVLVNTSDVIDATYR